ncbi:DUF4350 domain-containing protein [Rhizohabitans arisaemae]|uniref:DUF4350 domain-containing protein n=1 Tax=Rhizohabitans arisaemae TaxID=2720610 RepID=UPI0024B28080|nr:DUF4350 domain-containing protein [Rhizohabitans arisaemae]
MSTPTSPTIRGIARALRLPLALLLLMVVAATVATLIQPDERRQGRHLDPADTSAQGAKALAVLLAERGVTVHRVERVAEAAELATDDTTIVVTSSVRVGLEQLTTLAELPGDRVIVDPFPQDLPTLVPGVTVESGARPTSRLPGCSLPAATAAGTVFTGGVTFSAPEHGEGCYHADGEPTLVSIAEEGVRTVVLGDGEFMTNRRLAEDGNAALALNLLGARPNLIWLMPSPLDRPPPGEGGESFEDLIPAGVLWATLQLVIAVVFVALWRGRRLGPVVSEALPVVVRAAETVEGRGRLYRSRHAHDRAAAALRAGALGRITGRLGLNHDADPDAITQAIAVRTGRDPVQVAEVLHGPPPAGDAELVVLADQLDTVEREVRGS